MSGHGLVAPCVWNIPGPRIKPVSPVLAGRLLSTGPPGKSTPNIFLDEMQKETPFPGHFALDQILLSGSG